MDVPKPNPTPTPIELESSLSLVSATRGTEIGISDAAQDYQSFSPIQFFLMSGTDASSMNKQREGQFVYESEGATKGWTSTIGLKDTYNCLYGFSPAQAVLCSMSPAEGASYYNGAKMEFTNLSATSGNDLCVVVGVKHGNTASEANVIPERGQFYFEKKTNNYISLLLDHVFARIDFKIKLGEKYSKMRFIKVKKLELQSTCELTGVTVTLTPAATDVKYTTKPVSSDGTVQTGTLYDFTTDEANVNGKDITVNGTVFPGFFAPDDGAQVAKSLSLVCTYDVYAIDACNNKIGTRVREDCVAVNSLSGVTALASLSRGKKTTVNLTVEPTYLYQLSDDELDNPTIVVSE